MRETRDKGELALLIASPLVGLAYGLLTGLVFDLGWLDDWYAIVTLTYTFGVPVVVGVLAVAPTPPGRSGSASRGPSRRASWGAASAPFNWYTSLWTDLFMSDIQQTILQVIKVRSEAAAGG